MTDATRLSLAGADPNAERTEALKALFPEAFPDGALDFARLQTALGAATDPKTERYGLNWAGKGEAVRASQTVSMGTLMPAREESVGWDKTENVIIEGDNLEVLKLLQTAYHRQVKMIYIDPPYNTGNDFLYPDNFRAGLSTYLRFSGQVGENGVKMVANREENGRFHSDWLSMMLPRLHLAKNLLRDDGVIFVSIDDHEVANLRLLMDEVFGEENFVADVIWQHSVQGKNDAKGFSLHHNYILTYARSPSYLRGTINRTEEHNKAYSNQDKDPKGEWRAGDVRSPNYRENLCYPIKPPKGKPIQPPTNGWRWAEKVMLAKIVTGEVSFVDNGTRILRKIYLVDQQGRVPESIWFAKDVGSTREAAEELKQLFDGHSPFETPKPTRLLKRLLEISASSEQDKDDIILDFFAGSGTTAHAVLEQNKADGGNRRFIMVQLPEPIENGPYKTIAEITKERVRRVIKKMDAADSNANGEDRGFRAYKLASSCFNLWDGQHAGENADALAGQLKLFIENRKPERTEEDVFCELLLKCGFPLAAKTKSHTVGGQKFVVIGDSELAISLADPIDEKTLRGMMKMKPGRVLVLDSAFGGNDALKTNYALQMQDAGIQFQTV